MRKNIVYLTGIWLFVLIAGLLVSCSADEDTTDTAFTPTPTFANVTGDAYTIVNTQVCLITTLNSIQTDANRDLGTLIAWSPDGSQLAFVEPFSGNWGWYDGNLAVYDLTNGRSVVSKDIKVSGDLTWSPDGSKLAFTALRVPENRYTVMVRSSADGTITDLYKTLTPTDAYGSQKGIIGWKNENVLQLTERCGVDCVQRVEYDTASGQITQLDEIRPTEDASLLPVNNLPSLVANENWLKANFSPDLQRAFFVDNRDVAWIAALKSQIKFPLDIGYNTVAESAWSPDAQEIAVRGQGTVFLFSFDCP
jgi:WD40 repeat protein